MAENQFLRVETKFVSTTEASCTIYNNSGPRFGDILPIN